MRTRSVEEKPTSTVPKSTEPGKVDTIAVDSSLIERTKLFDTNDEFSGFPHIEKLNLHSHLIV